MKTRVIFRFNHQTGAVETFTVEGTSDLEGAAHNREHEERAAAIGRLLDPDAGVSEQLPGSSATPEPERRVEEPAHEQRQRNKADQR